MAAAGPQAPLAAEQQEPWDHGVPLGSSEESGGVPVDGDSEGALSLGQLDFTSQPLSLAGLEKELEAFADSDLLRAILDQGVDPREYGRQYEARLRDAEAASVQDYLAEADSLAELHAQISECDSILGGLEGMLGRFQGDLGAASAEIRALQEQSQSMSLKLKNRKALQEKLESFIENVAVPPALIYGIVQGEMGEAFIGHLEALSGKLEWVARDEAAKYSAAYRDVAPELERLKAKALARSRDFLMERIYDMRRPKTNMQIKQNVLLRYKYMVTFLRQHGGDIHKEVRAAYCDKVGGKMLDLFRAYWGAMDRLEEVVVTPSDLLAAPEGAAGPLGVMSFLKQATSGLGSSSSSSSSGGGGSASRAEVFALRGRAGVLAQLEAPPIILHVLEGEGRKLPYEALFRSVCRLLMDSAAHEYLFCSEFWGEEGAYATLIAPVLGFVEVSLAAALQELHDPLALLLMVRINREHGLAMSRRRNPALDGFFDRLNLMLWPRLKALLDVQLASVKALHPTPSTVDSVPRLHPLTERYASLTASMLLLHADFLDGPLDTNLERMRYAVMNLLLQMSRQFGGRGQGTVFLILNFGHVVESLRQAAAQGLPPAPGSGAAAGGGGGAGQEALTLGNAGVALLKEFEDSLARCSGIYVDEQLGRVVPQLVHFVRRGEAAAGGLPEGRPIPGFTPAEAGPLARDFTQRWQAVVEAVNREVGKDFGASPAAGRSVLQSSFTQLLLHWNRFLELCKRQGPQGLAIVREAVTMPSIMYGLKSYNR